MTEPTKPYYVTPLEYFNLERACDLVNKSFEGYGCYLVGSAKVRRDFRDVDVRFIMPDVTYDEMFSVGGEWKNDYWSFLSVVISTWIGQQTGLKVDFQIQRFSHANACHDGPRHPLGNFNRYPGEAPYTLLADMERVKERAAK